MPKEYVRSIAPNHGEDTDFRVRVGWDREASYVQIATVRHGEAGHGDGYQLGEDDGLYVDLDRDAINDLIRVLRRARDQSFGRDE